MDEYDYMSDDLLAQCATNDVRPGLLFNKKLQREHTVYQKHLENRQKNRPLREIEEEKRNEGLQTAISEENKGFQLMRKMGYTAGTGLGKSKSGLTKPIDVNVKSSNSGLGLENHRLEKMEAKKVHDVEHYQAHVLKKANERQLTMDYQKSQKSCLTLDTRGDKNARPFEIWYWPLMVKPKEDDDSEEDEEEKEHKPKDFDEMSDRLDMLTKYLRTKHCYCVWCGVEYDDEKDLATACPGPSRELHDD